MPAGHSGESGSQIRPLLPRDCIGRHASQLPPAATGKAEGQAPEPKDRPSEVTTRAGTMAAEGDRLIHTALLRSSFYVDSASRIIATLLEPHCEGIVG